jgi:hypothetical protein
VRVSNCYDKEIHVCFFLGNSPASEFYMPTFQNTLSMKMEQCSETSAYKIQTPRNYLEENIQHTEHGESLKSRRKYLNKFLWDLILEFKTDRYQTNAILSDIVAAQTVRICNYF